MPIGGEAMGNAIGGFFGGPKVKQIIYNKNLGDAQNQQGIQLQDLAKYGDTAQRAYAAAVAASTPQAQAINQENIGTLGTLANQYAAYDPTANYERIRSGNISSLADQFVNMASLGQEGDKLALAARGYGGSGPGSYESILRSDRISRNIAPVLNTIYGNLGTDASRTSADRLSNLQATMALLQTRGALPGSLDYRALLPYQSQANMLGGQIAMGGDLANAYKANVAGFQSTPNKWANFFQQSGRAADQVADTAVSLAGDVASMYSGGMLGGFGGGGGGAAAAPAAPAQTSPWASFGTMQPYSPPAYSNPSPYPPQPVSPPGYGGFQMQTTPTWGTSGYTY